jgi:hypothetical protein
MEIGDMTLRWIDAFFGNISFYEVAAFALPGAWEPANMIACRHQGGRKLRRMS